MKTMIMGDLSPTVDNEHLFFEGDKEALFGDFLPMLEGNDVNLLNLECALTEHDQKIKKFGPALKSHPNTAKLLREIGVNYCSVCNNHFFDFGKKGVEDSFRALNAQGIAYTGYGCNYEDARRDLILEKQGERVAVIAVCEHEYSYALEDREGCRPFDEFDTMLDIRAAKEKNDRVIVIYHGGKEYCRYPSPRLRKLCRAMAAHGADLVLCQHSHCIGCYERVQGCHILYGQGNFHFEEPSDKNLPECWNGGLAVHYDTVTNAVDFIPVVSNQKAGIRLANEQERAQMMGEMEARNQSLADGTWRERWHEFCESMRPVYEKAVSRAYREEATEKHNHLFAHYLDCEAHTDVWRELFPTANLTNEKA